MTATSSPWSREASPSVALPPSPPSSPPLGPPQRMEVAPRQTRGRFWGLAALALLLVIAVSGGVSAAVTYIALGGGRSSSNATPRANATPSSPTTTPRISSADVAAATRHLCHTAEVSVGDKSEGGFRIQGNLNLPVTLRAINSAVAVENAITAAIPPDTAAAARTYVSTTLDVTTAAMSNASAAEVNRLTDLSNAAMYALFDACGLPR